MSYLDDLNQLTAAGEPFVTVTVVETSGSVPAEPGAKMLITGSGRHSGTVGGGEVEQAAIAKGVEMLQSASSTELVSWNLTRDLGMTCAGLAKLFFEVWNGSAWNIVIFGAGHVANAVTKILVELDCRITCIDPRDEWLEKLPRSDRLRTVRTDSMPSMVASIPDGAFVLVMTMSHDSDREVLEEILRTRSFPYLGVIGSASKAKRMRAQLIEAGLDEPKAESYISPIGLPLGSNQPAEIAVSVVAQLIQVRDERSQSSAS